MQKTFLSAFGQRYTKNLISRNKANDIAASINMDDVIKTAYDELPEMSGCEITAYLNLSDGQVEYINIVGAGGVVEEGHLVTLYCLSYEDVRNIPDSDLLTDSKEEIPNGDVRNFADYHERVVTALQYYHEEQDQDSTWMRKVEAQIEGIYSN